MNVDLTTVNLKRLFYETVLPQVTHVGLKLLGALAMWIIGRTIIAWIVRRVERALNARKIDSTVFRYIGSLSSGLLTLALALGIAGFMGLEAVTFAALLAGVGLAIGTAWGDLLKNFAAGAFLLVLRPFRVGDLVSVAGRFGWVEEIGIFVCTLSDLDNARVIIGNGKIFGDIIQNFYTGYLRLEIKVPVGYQTNPSALLAALAARIPKVPKVLATPDPWVRICEFNSLGYVIAVQPCCLPPDALSVGNESRVMIAEELSKAGIAPPATLSHRMPEK